METLFEELQEKMELAEDILEAVMNTLDQNDPKNKDILERIKNFLPQEY